MGLGNDDQEDLIPLLEGAHVGYAVEGAMDFGDVTLVSLGCSNPTPWHTHREASEDELARRLAELTEGSTRSARSSTCTSLRMPRAWMPPRASTTSCRSSSRAANPT